MTYWLEESSIKKFLNMTETWRVNFCYQKRLVDLCQWKKSEKRQCFYKMGEIIGGNCHGIVN